MKKTNLTRSFKPYYFVALMLLLASCEDSITADRIEIESNDSEILVDLNINQTAFLTEQQLSIRFDEVVSDSRCPTSVTCAWEGNAVVSITINEQAAELNTTSEPTEIFISGYSVTLIELAPYPESAGSIENSEYEIRLKVTNNSD